MAPGHEDGESEERFCPRPQWEVRVLRRTERCDVTTAREVFLRQASTFVTALRTNCLPGTLPRTSKVCWGVNCCQENSSPVGPEVWVVVMFSATEALTEEKVLSVKKLHDKGKKCQFYCQIRSSPRGVNELYLVSCSVQGKISLVYSQDEGGWGKERKIAASTPVYMWARLRSNGENITQRLLQRSFHLE